MLSRDTLRTLFRPLHTEAIALAPRAFEENTTHACGYLVTGAYHDRNGKRQPPAGWPASWRTHWQLPEPFIGDIERHEARIAFVGLNPSIDARERCPGVEAALDAWLDFWRDGFGRDGRLRVARAPVPLYEYYAEALATADARAVLGRDAVVTDVVRYKALSPVGALERLGHRNLRAAIAHTTSLPLTRSLLARLGVSVVVTVGREATRTLGASYVPALANENVTAVHGRVYESGELTVVPALHSNHRGFGPTHVRALGVALARAIG